MVAIAQSGDLAEIELPQLLLDLHRARFNGRVLLARERAEKTMILQGGDPVVAESNLASESLGVKLMDAGTISREDHLRVSSHMLAKGCKEGAALLELGLIEPRELFVALKEQVRGRIVDCFAWPGGRFEVDPSETVPDAAQPFRADVYALVQEGIETHWSPDRILADLSGHMDMIVSRNRRLQRIQDRLRWDDDVQALLDALDGSRTLWQALSAGRSPRAHAAAWLLSAVRALDYRDPGIATSGAETPPEVEIVLTETAETPAEQAVTTSRAPEGTPTQTDSALASQIEETFEALAQLDHYAVLGVANEASGDAIRAAYLDAAKRFHPDALARAGLDTTARTKAGKVFSAIGRAHGVLSNPTRRRDYDKSLTLDDTDLDAERLAAAETNFRKAEILLRQGNYRGAIEYLRPAVELWPEEAAYQGSLGFALYKMNPPDLEGARKHLEIAHELAPGDPQIAEHLALVRNEIST